MTSPKIKKLIRYIHDNGLPVSGSGSEWGGDEWQELFKAIKNNGQKKDNLLPLMPFTNMFFDILPDSAFLIDKNAVILKCNHIACTHLGYTAKELEGEGLRILFFDQIIYEFFYSDLVKNDQIKDVELVLKARDGRLLTFIMSGLKLPLTDTDDIFLCMGADISDLKQIEDTLRAEKKKAEQANRAKSDFLANMSHEIRTPLNGIIGLNGLMLTTKLGSEQKELSDMIRVSAETLLSLLNDILDFSKIEAGKLLIEQQPFSIQELVGTVSTIISHQLNDKKLRFVTRVSPAVPDLLIGDVSRIRQVLVNLLGNAIKFTSQGHISLSIELYGEMDARLEIKFSVKDTGIGIPKEKQKSIFAAFSQADVSTTREYGGTGLGLSICQRLVKLMDGQLNVFSQYGEGATFWFTLPLLPVTDKQQKIKVAKKDTAIDLHGLSRLKILLVDDNLINQKVASRILVKAGHTVIVAGNGLEAVNQFRTARFDVVLMDLQMPVMDGLSAAREIRKIETDVKQQTPILALTANVLDGQKEKCVQAGMSGFLTKPIRLNELFTALNEIHHGKKPVPGDGSVKILFGE